MGLYVSFPVGLFHYFNSPGNIEASIEETRRNYIDKFIGVQEFEKRRQDIADRKMKNLEERAKKAKEA
ncbi:hypothetical protein ONE63_002300 [Megalurothrips usitatus]|uniref:Protein PET100 homolog, mitochondrial n=1 Tax=Megalurothrips usitatus TaxID=439358 RepID=A0AAV7XBG1_9NEOP|nr:hypothetical protein ONE63_002300 [Megalurothrips usitatus]